MSITTELRANKNALDLILEGLAEQDAPAPEEADVWVDRLLSLIAETEMLMERVGMVQELTAQVIAATATCLGIVL